jgi:hypothetical protein
MIRIRLEGNNWNEIVEQLRQMIGDDKPLPIFGVSRGACQMAKNTSPPVEPIDKGDGLTEFRPITPDKVAEPYGEGSEIHRHAIAAANQPAPPTIPAIDALPQTPPPPVAATPVSDVDARGIPWDARCHAGNKATTKDGSWKRRRGVSVEEVQRIEAELTAGPSAVGTKAEAALSLVTQQTETTLHVGPEVQPRIEPVIAPPPPPAPAELPGTEPPPVTFDQVMREAGLRNLGITNLNALTAEVTGGQIGQIALIADKPAYIQAVYDRVTAS